VKYQCEYGGLSPILVRYSLQLTRYDEKGWHATFYTTGIEHSIMSATASAWERTPWRATQRAAWEALKKEHIMTAA